MKEKIYSYYLYVLKYVRFSNAFVVKNLCFQESISGIVIEIFIKIFYLIRSLLG